MKSRRTVAALIAAVLVASPATAFAAAKDSTDSSNAAAQHEAKQIAEGKAKDGKMLAPAPDNLPPAPPPGPPGVPPIPMGPPAPAPAELDGSALIFAIFVVVAGVALYADVRRQNS